MKDLRSTQIRLSINKIQGTTRRDIIKTYRKCTGLVLKNIFIIIPLLSFFLQSLVPTELFKLSDIAKFPINVILIEVLFYSTHRIMHIGFLYKRYHKKHHEIPIPVSISALYLHPVDFIFSNFFPVVLPPYILNHGVIAFSLWIIFSIFNTVYISHQGQRNLSEFHDYHHEKTICNYGTELFLDKLMGTYKKKNYSN